MQPRIGIIACLCLLLPAIPTQAKVFNVAPGDVTDLIAAITAANGDSQADTLRISGTYVLTAIHNVTEGNNGLPAITTTITIEGRNGATIRRNESAGTPVFRILHVTATGALTLNGVTIANGLLDSFGTGRAGTGGGILSLGNLAISNSSIVDNDAGDGPGGISQRAAGTSFSLHNSIVSRNRIGGIFACCTVNISNSTISNNEGVALVAGSSDATGHVDIVNSSIYGNHTGGETAGVMVTGDVAIVNTTISDNVAGSDGPAAVFLFTGTLSLVNVTIARNSTSSSSVFATGGIDAGLLSPARIEMVNTLLAANTAAGVLKECGFRTITSLGHNLIDTIEACRIDLQPSDLIGAQAGLDGFVDDGTPGNGHVVMLPQGAGINAGDNAVCQSNPLVKTDQIGNPRVGICDIGAIEFQSKPSEVVFAGTPGTPSCHGDSVSALVRQYGNLPAAASALGFSSVQALQDAIKTFCRE